MTRRWCSSVASLALCLIALGAQVHASVPGQVQYQGLLLDNVGAPINASVDLDFQLFDALTGGTSLWSESHVGVSVLDGVYEVALGSSTPLTTAVLAGGAVYLEVTADSEVMTPRQRLLAVPYALEAEHAADADAVNGLGASFVTEIYEHFDFDGDPPSTDPREGLGDTDGDGIANFIDSDNDNDGISDSAELAQSTDMNLVTPIVTGTSPTSANFCAPHTVQVQGANFLPGLSVVFGSETPTASSITSTSFSVDVGPQTPGFVDVTVTNANAETDTASGAFEFFDLVQSITGYLPVRANFDTTTTVTILGSGFDPATVVVFGTETPTPFNVTPTSLDVNVGPQALGPVTVTVTNGCGTQTMDSSFAFRDFRHAFVTSTSHDGALGGAAGADAICQARADEAGLSGTYFAWIADGSTDPASRFSQYADDYILATDAVLVNDWADLTDGSLDLKLDVDENGVAVGLAEAWTGVNPDGTALAAGDPNTHCNGFTANSGFNGGRGATNVTNAFWTYNNFNPTQPCSIQKRLYCFQQ